MAGWLVALPVPLLLIWAPSWGWVVFANVLLGISQGLTWSTTVVMKIDLVGPARRGLAMGFNEAAGYAAVALTALATGYIAADHGLRPAPFYLGIAFAALGLGISTLFVRETREYARLEATSHVARSDGRHDHLGDHLSDGEVFAQTSFQEPALSAASQAGLVNNLNDGLAWGLFPVLFLSAGLSIERIGAARRDSTRWSGASGSCVTGGLSDRWGRKWLIAAGMGVQALGARRSSPRPPASPGGPSQPCCSAPAPPWSTRPCSPRSATSPTPPGAPARWASTGSGATPASPSAPCSPASSPTCYGVRAAIWAVAALTAASGLVVAVRMYETRPRPGSGSPGATRRFRMSKREAKTALYEQFARAGKGLSNPKRLELLDLIAQGEYTVDAALHRRGTGLSTTSMHLQALKDSGLVRTRREGTFVHYRLAGDDVAALLVAAAERRHHPHRRRRPRRRGLPGALRERRV